MATKTKSELGERLQSIQAISELVHASSDFTSILERTVYGICKHSRWTTGGVLCVDETAGKSTLLARYDPYVTQAVPPFTWPLETSPTLKVAEERKPLIIRDIRTTDKYPEFSKDAAIRDYRVAVIVPMNCKDLRGRPLVISMQCRNLIDVTDEEIAFLETCAQIASTAVNNAHIVTSERTENYQSQNLLAMQRELAAACLESPDLHTLLHTVESRLPACLVAVDLLTNQIAAGASPAPGIVTAEQWQSFVANPGRNPVLMLARGAIGADADPKIIDFTPYGLNLATPAAVEPLMFEDQLVGAILLFTTSVERDSVNKQIVDFAKFAFTVQLARRLERFRAEGHSAETIVEELIRGTFHSSERLLARARAVGLQIDRPGRILIVDLTDHADGDKPSAFDSHLRSSVVRTADRIRPGSAVALLGEFLVVFLPLTKENDAEESLEFAQQIEKSAAAAIGANCALTLSDTCTELEHYRAVYEKCIRTLSLARMIGRKGVVTERDFGPAALLYLATDHPDIRAFVDATLGGIEGHDNAGGELIGTIDAFLRNNCRFQATADHLSIHVTTLKYRLDRIETLFGIDLADPDTRFKLEFALRLRALTGGQRSKTGRKQERQHGREAT
ncbi:MAG: helix-turn-helix domain-containing protein [Pseudorhodoplanes sp.]